LGDREKKDKSNSTAAEPDGGGVGVGLSAKRRGASNKSLFRDDKNQKAFVLRTAMVNVGKVRDLAWGKITRRQQHYPKEDRAGRWIEGHQQAYHNEKAKNNTRF